jgi:hypothetical protein
MNDASMKPCPFCGGNADPGPVEHCARLNIASGIPERVAQGERRLEDVRKCRDLKKAVA